MDNKKLEDLQSRREFFKSAAQSALPILAAAALGPAILTSCENQSLKCDCYGGCTGGCSGECSGSCLSDCMNGCDRWMK